MDSRHALSKHVFVNRAHTLTYDQDIQASLQSACVIQIDFAENYPCAFQDEV